ncbi:type II secretion system protein [bacterium]|nr:type II secretion system protein [bacterium]
MNTKRLSQKQSNAAGFTLVELMVVVAIIGILAAVAGPRVQAFRARGTQAEAKTNLNSIYIAMVAYQDANDKFPTIAASTACAEGADCGGIAFRPSVGSKYSYGIISAEGDGWAAGAGSKTKLLNATIDVWRINTNKTLCSIKDALVRDQTTRKGACATGDVKDDGKVAALVAEDKPTE